MPLATSVLTAFTGVNSSGLHFQPPPNHYPFRHHRRPSLAHYHNYLRPLPHYHHHHLILSLKVSLYNTHTHTYIHSSIQDIYLYIYIYIHYHYTFKSHQTENEIFNFCCWALDLKLVGFLISSKPTTRKFEFLWTHHNLIWSQLKLKFKFDWCSILYVYV